MKGQLTSYDCQFFWLEVETIEAGKSASKLCAFLGDGAFKLNQSCKKKQLMLKLKAKLVQVLVFFFCVCTQFASKLDLQDTQTISF